MRALIIPNFQKERTPPVLREVCRILEQLHVTPVGLAESREDVLSAGVTTVEYGCHNSWEGTAASCDFILSIGGDGTIIRSAYYSAVADRPLVGVNVGTLGFLAQMEPEHLEQGLRRICDGRYAVEKRFALTAEFSAPDTTSLDFALNDIVVSKSGRENIAGFEIYYNGKLIDRYFADGVIFSTPTGSTAYALAAGGPVIDPGLATISVVPICPHSIATRPIVFSGDKAVSLLLTSGDALVHGDGKLLSPLEKDGMITVSRSKLEAKFISFNEYEFFEILTAKIKQKG